MELYIKNMVCHRCIVAVEQALTEVGILPLRVTLGEATVEKEPTEAQQQALRQKLETLGFELLDDARKQLIEKIKAIVIQRIHYGNDTRFVFSEVLARELAREYSQLSKLFSTTEGITIEQYVILQKIEKVKELLVYNQSNLNEIADQMGYSSVAHLSGQFKKVTGLTPSQFKQQGIHLRKPLDRLGR